MPQLDINSFLPILYWLCLSFNFSFIFIYLTYFFSLINQKKIIFWYKLKMFLRIINILAVLKNNRVL